MKEMVIKFRIQENKGDLEIDINGLNRLEIERGLIEAVIEISKRGAARPEAIALGIVNYKELEDEL